MSWWIFETMPRWSKYLILKTIMWNQILLQACLRLDKKDIPTNLKIGKEYSFKKNDHRLYQINVPMDLRTSDRNFICRIIITEYTIGKWSTQGTYIPVKFFTEEENKTITKTFVSDTEVIDILKQC